MRPLLIALFAAVAGWWLHDVTDQDLPATEASAPGHTGSGMTHLGDLILAREEINLDAGDHLKVLVLQGPPGEVVMIFERLHVLDGFPAWRRKIQNFAVDSSQGIEITLDDDRVVSIAPEGPWGGVGPRTGRRIEIQVVD